jgi:hypothetical protein
MEGLLERGGDEERVYACEMYAYERHACKIHAHETYAYEAYPYEIHTRDMHACKTPAHEMHTREIYTREIYAHRSIAFLGRYDGAGVTKGCPRTKPIYSEIYVHLRCLRSSAMTTSTRFIKHNEHPNPHHGQNAAVLLSRLRLLVVAGLVWHFSFWR